jgi:hypothetical protein
MVRLLIGVYGGRLRIHLLEVIYKQLDFGERNVPFRDSVSILI